MKNILPIALIFLLVVFGFYFFSKKQANLSSSQANQMSGQNSESISGVFKGITPCSNTNAECEMTIWDITFNDDFTYSLTASYGMSQPGTTGIKGGGTKVNMEGKWIATKGTKTNPNANVIQLNTADPQTSISFVKLTDNIIHLLDADKNMMVGNGGWAYTLSKVNPISTNDAALFSTQTEAPALGIFEGRSVCTDSLMKFTKTPEKDCEKIKWKLTLSPARYLLQTSLGVSEGDVVVEGNVYALKPYKTQQVLLLLNVDENHLFILDNEMNVLLGNTLWNNTLSRTGKDYEKN
jgi:hypothetical protein